MMRLLLVVFALIAAAPAASARCMGTSTREDVMHSYEAEDAIFVG